MQTFLFSNFCTPPAISLTSLPPAVQLAPDLKKYKPIILSSLPSQDSGLFLNSCPLAQHVLVLPLDQNVCCFIHQCHTRLSKSLAQVSVFLGHCPFGYVHGWTPGKEGGSVGQDNPSTCFKVFLPQVQAGCLLTLVGTITQAEGTAFPNHPHPGPIHRFHGSRLVMPYQPVGEV